MQDTPKKKFMSMHDLPYHLFFYPQDGRIFLVFFFSQVDLSKFLPFYIENLVDYTNQVNEDRNTLTCHHAYISDSFKADTQMCPNKSLTAEAVQSSGF